MKFQKGSRLNETRLLGAIFISVVVTVLSLVGGFYLSQITGVYEYGIVDFVLMALVSVVFFFGALPVCYHVLSIMDKTRMVVTSFTEVKAND